MDTSTVTFLIRYGIIGMAGTMLVSVGALGVGWLPLSTALVDQPIIEALRGSTAGILVSRGLILTGVALLLQAWILLGFDLMSGVRWPVSRLQILAAVWSAPLLLAPPLFSRDVYSYYAQGRLFQEGFDPYLTGVSVVPGWFQDGVDPMWAETPTPYGPLFLILERTVATVALGQPFLAALLFRLIALIGVVLLVLVVPKLAWQHGIDPAKALWIGVLNPLIIMHFVAGAHNDALMVGLMVTGLWLAGARRPLVGTVLVTLAAAIKPIALVALPFVGLLWAATTASWPRRLLAEAKTLVVAAVVFGAVAVVAGVGLGWVNALTAPGSVRTWLSPLTALGMASGWLLTSVGLLGSDDLTVTIARLIGMVAAVGVIGWLLIRPQGRSPVRAAAIALAAVVVLGPVLQPWYLLWFLPLLAATGLGPRQVRWTILLTALFAIHGMSESSATSDNLLELTDGLAILTAAAVVAIVLLASPRERAMVLGPTMSHGLLPEDPPSLARSSAMTFTGKQVST